jgi:hypothetical protein
MTRQIVVGSAARSVKPSSQIKEFGRERQWNK